MVRERGRVDTYAAIQVFTYKLFIAQYYAAKLAIAKGPRTKETNEYLSHLLDALEKVRNVFFFS